MPAGDLDADVLVVGGGPVGLAAAIEARLAGLSVLVLEPRSGPVDKACGEGLMPGALAAVHRLGVDPDGHELTGIAYVDATRRVEHRFTRGTGRGVRRTVLHRALARRAAELGAQVVVGRASDLRQDAHGVVIDDLRAGHVLACDGLHSTVRRLVGLEVPVRRARADERRRFGLRRHYRVRPWGDLVEVHWAPHAEAYVTPVGPDLVGVAVLGPVRTDLDATLDALPALARHLAGAQPDGPVRGAGPLLQRTTARTAGRVLLVGDASGYVDALTGEGLRVGLAQAAAAVAHLDDPAGYERAWARATRDYRVLTTGLVAAATSPARRTIVPAAARLPRVYGAIVDRLAR
ncbi:NAD(P)/FAD-dependent oxidoreductase [Cellulomonas palmilytica]|uniref:NAD(P)/FAD-dependent oxidoreductase n=1 Tax=Cellulomonas palmilytica TaxID=2608402 RepID=UPI001F3388F3|nr:NAD(P)/FAD-dependent oxidoreductase [Cellulomonas palmilytica]UJP40338.1 NAD(P)/FAD-dependent oxidoreductase [Cellulomonas palmilytica]